MKLESAGQTVQIGSNGGVGHIMHGAADVEALLKQADAELYAAKAAGKNRVLPYFATACSGEFSCIIRAWHAHESKLRGYLTHCIGNAHLAEDLLQETQPRNETFRCTLAVSNANPGIRNYFPAEFISIGHVR